MDLTSHNSRVKRSGTKVYMAPLIDIVFLLLIFFMSAAIFYQLEGDLNITVPSADQAEKSPRMAGEIVINIDQNGDVIVNQRQLSDAELKDLLVRIAQTYKDQPVIIRADKQTFHEHVIKVLDMCAGAGIWNISFAAIKDEEEL